MVSGEDMMLMFVYIPNNAISSSYNTAIFVHYHGKASFISHVPYFPPAADATITQNSA